MTLDTSNFERSHAATALVEAGRAYQAKGAWQEALRAYDQALRLAPSSAIIHSYKGQVLQAWGDEEVEATYPYPYYNYQHHREAIQAFDQSLRLDPTMSEAAERKKQVVAQLQQYEEGLTTYENASTLVTLQRYQDALAACDPTLAESYVKQGYALTFLQRYNEALVAYDEALRLNPHDIWTAQERQRVLKERER